MLMELNEISGQIVDAAMKVHSALGPGLLETVCEVCLRREIEKRGLSVQSQVTMPVVYDGVTIDTGFRVDLLIEEQVVVELKAVEELLPVHKAQLLTYLKLCNKKVGLLINFNVPHLSPGIKRMVN